MSARAMQQIYQLNMTDHIYLIWFKSSWKVINKFLYVHWWFLLQNSPDFFLRDRTSRCRLFFDRRFLILILLQYRWILSIVSMGVSRFSKHKADWEWKIEVINTRTMSVNSLRRPSSFFNSFPYSLSPASSSLLSTSSSSLKNYITKCS